MPCNQVRTTTCAFEAANVTVLASAMRVLGFEVQKLEATRITFRTDAGVQGMFANGRITTYDGELQLDKLKTEYARQSVVATCKAKGWQMRFCANGNIVATKRTFA